MDAFPDDGSDIYDANDNDNANDDDANNDDTNDNFDINDDSNDNYDNNDDANDDDYLDHGNLRCSHFVPNCVHHVSCFQGQQSCLEIIMIMMTLMTKIMIKLKKNCNQTYWQINTIQMCKPVLFQFWIWQYLVGCFPEGDAADFLSKTFM